MRSAHRLLSLISLLLVLMSPLSHAQQKALPDLSPVYEWLGLIDAQRYYQSWQYAGDYFKKTIDASAWDKVLQASRGQMGPINNRELIAFGRKTTLSGLPQGNYLVLQFRSQFGADKHINELVYLSEEPSGLKVVGYYLQ